MKKPQPPLPPVMNNNILEVGHISMSSFDMSIPELSKELIELLKNKEVREYLGIVKQERQIGSGFG